MKMRRIAFISFIVFLVSVGVVLVKPQISLANGNGVTCAPDYSTCTGYFDTGATVNTTPGSGTGCYDTYTALCNAADPTGAAFAVDPQDCVNSAQTDVSNGGIAPWGKYKGTDTITYLSNSYGGSQVQQGLYEFQKFTNVYSTADKIYNDVQTQSVDSNMGYLLSAGSCTDPWGTGVVYKASCSYNPNTYSFSQGQLDAPSWEQDSYTPPREGDAASGYLTCYSTSCPPSATTQMLANGSTGSFSVTPNTPVTISWASTNTQSCTIINPDGSIVSVPSSGSGSPQSLAPGTYTWTINCYYSYPPSTASPYVGPGCYSGTYAVPGTSPYAAPAPPASVTVTVAGGKSSTTSQEQYYYYCLTSNNACTQTSQQYASDANGKSQCESNLQIYHSGQTDGVCYSSNSSCTSACSGSNNNNNNNPTYYYCSNNSCVSTNKYPTQSACSAINGQCYTSSSCNSACGTTTPPPPPPPPPQQSSKDISISIDPSSSCLPQNGTNNSTNISWSVNVTNFCPAGYVFNGTDAGTCSSNLPNGPTTAPSSGNSTVTINQTQTYTISCSRTSYTCTQDYQCNPHDVTVTNPNGSTSTQVVYDTCTRKQDYNGSSASNSTTVHYVNAPTIESFTATPQNILLNKSTVLSWLFDVFGQDASISTAQYCYPSGGSGDPTGWNTGYKYYPPIHATPPLYPQKTTTYDLTCRNYDTADTSCYNETTQSTTANVYTTNIYETNPSGIIEQAWSEFWKRLGL